MPIDEISVAQFRQTYTRGMKLIDVREVDEYELGHVAGAINIPLSQLADRISEIDDSTTYFICKSGSRSMKACELSVDAGKSKVVNVAGGTLGWISAGNETVVGGRPE